MKFRLQKVGCCPTCVLIKMIKDPLESLRELLHATVLGLCLHPEDLTVEMLADRHPVELIIRPHIADYPKIVGSEGRTIDSLKRLFSRLAIEHYATEAQVSVTDTPLKGLPTSPVNVEFNPNWRPTAVLLLVGDIMRRISGSRCYCGILARGGETIYLELDCTEPERISQDDLDDLNRIFNAYARTQAGNKIKIQVKGVVEAGGRAS